MRRANLDMSRDLLDDEAGGIVTLQRAIDGMNPGVTTGTLSRSLHRDGIMISQSLKKVLGCQNLNGKRGANGLVGIYETLSTETTWFL